MTPLIGFVGTTDGIRVYFSFSRKDLIAFTGHEFIKPVKLFGRELGYFGSLSMVNWANMPNYSIQDGFNSFFEPNK